MRSRQLFLVILVLITMQLPTLSSFAEADCSFSGEIERTYGADRYETAAQLAKDCFGEVEQVVIATGEQFPDALSGSALAGAVDGPIILVRENSLPSAARSALISLDPDKAYILGGTGAISLMVEDRIRALGISTERLSGSDRYKTSAAIAREIDDLDGGINDERAFIVTGENFPDALSVSPLAAKSHYPVLLVRTDDVPGAIDDALGDLDIEEVFVIGGVGAVSTETVTELDIDGSRIEGSDRYRTSAEVFEHAQGDIFRMSSDTLYVASGTSFPDALVAGPIAALKDNATLMLVNQGPGMDLSVIDFFVEHGEEIDNVVVVGGPSVISEDILNSIEDGMNGDLEDPDEDNDGVPDSQEDEDDTGKYGDELTVDMTKVSDGHLSTGEDFDVDANVRDEHGVNVEDAEVTMEIHVSKNGGSFSGDRCHEAEQDYGPFTGCTEDSDEDGNVRFENIPVNGLEDGDEIKIIMRAQRSGMDDGKDMIVIPVYSN